METRLNERLFDLDLVNNLELEFQIYCEVEDFEFGLPAEKKRQKLELLEKKILNLIQFASAKLPQRDFEVSITDRALLQYWKGRLDYLRGNLKTCADYLIESVKLDPSLVRGWITLGEAFVKVAKPFQAKSCFEQANAQKETPLGLTFLSKLYRSGLLSRDDQEMSEHFAKSIEIAKHALKYDVKDGSLWFSLANSHTQYFMVVSKDLKNMELALKAYDQSRYCETNSFDEVPDLHFNIATIHRFYANYDKSLESLERASELADQEVDAEKALKEVEAQVLVLGKLSRTRCGLSRKKIEKFASSIKQTIRNNQLKSRTFPQIMEGKNPNTVIYARFISSPILSPTCTIMCLDKSLTVFPVSVSDVKFTLPTLQAGCEIIILNPIKRNVDLQRERVSTKFSFCHITRTSNLLITKS